MNFILDTSLVLYLTLYQLDGSSFMSKDAYGHLCTVTGAVWRPNGHYFDGSDDKIDCGNSSAFNFTNALTVDSWVNLKSASGASDWPGIVDKDAAYSLRLNQSGTNIYGRFKVGGASKFTNAYTATLDTWHHAVLLYEYPGNMTIYINGNEGVAAIAADGALDTNANDVLIGSTASNFFINAIIGEVRIYNRVLTPSEIMRNYQATKWRYR